MNKWVSCGALSVISDSIFAYRAKEGTLGLTVVRSPIYGDLRIRDIDLGDDYPIMEQGITEGRLRVLFSGDAEDRADAFCSGVTVIDESNHTGTLPPAGSYVQLSGDGVGISCVKYAEDGGGIIVRIREYRGTAQHCILTVKGVPFETDVAPYEIKTLLYRDGTVRETDMLERQ